LEKAALVNAQFQGADLHGAWLRGAFLAGARANTSTIWPDGFDWRLPESNSKRTRPLQLAQNRLHHDHPVGVRGGPVGGHSSSGLPIDPVCRMAVDPWHGAGRLTHQGVEYCFCWLRCAGAFAKHPTGTPPMIANSGWHGMRAAAWHATWQRRVGWCERPAVPGSACRVAGSPTNRKPTMLGRSRCWTRLSRRGSPHP
jgi:YHS domain-containing protein